MGMRPSQAVIKRHLKRLANKYVGVEFQVIYASNGETAILPFNPETGELEATNPQRFVVYNAKKAVKAAWNKACEFDGIDPQNTFVVFSDGNAAAVDYNAKMGIYLDACRVLEGRR